MASDNTTTLSSRSSSATQQQSSGVGDNANNGTSNSTTTTTVMGSQQQKSSSVMTEIDSGNSISSAEMILMEGNKGKEEVEEDISNCQKSSKSSKSSNSSSSGGSSSSSSSKAHSLIVPIRGWTTENIQDVCDLWKLSSKEVDQLKELQERLSDIQHWKNSPYQVVRFLRARPGPTVDAAEDMFRAMIQWRKENNMETFLDTYTPPQEMIDYSPSAILKGCDKDGDPILIDRIGVADVTGMLHKFGKQEMIDRCIWMRELISNGAWIQEYETTTQQHGQQQKRAYTRSTLVIDVLGINKSHINRDILSIFKTVQIIEEQNYCEFSKRIIIIRAPKIFKAIWTIVKAFIDPGIKEKIIFAKGGSHSNEYLDVLEQYMDLSVLPASIYPNGGSGVAVQGMPQNFEGGKIPSSNDNYTPSLSSKKVLKK